MTQRPHGYLDEGWITTPAGKVLGFCDRCQEWTKSEDDEPCRYCGKDTCDECREEHEKECEERDG